MQAELDFSKSFLDDLIARGDMECPCCKRKARVSPLKVHSTLAEMLCKLYRASIRINGVADSYVHLTQFPASKTTSGRDFSIVHHWGIAEPMKASPDENKRSSGMWRLTQKGVEFVNGRLAIPRNAFVFDNRVVDYSQENVTIHTALGDDFDWFELIGRK